MSSSIPNIAIVGSGALGKTLMVQSAPFIDKGWLVSRSVSTTLQFDIKGVQAVALELGVPSGWNPEWIFLCVPDDTIAQMAQKLLDECWLTNVKAVIHTSGAHASSILTEVLPSRIGCGSWHPLQTFPPDAWTKPNPFHPSIISFEGDEHLFEPLNALASSLGARLYRVSPEEKMALHISAVMLSNFLIPFMEKGLSVLSAERIKTHGFGMEQLMKTTIRNVFEKGASQSLSGPAFRGDEQTLTRHREFFKTLDKNELRNYYDEMTNQIKDMAKR